MTILLRIINLSLFSRNLRYFSSSPIVTSKFKEIRIPIPLTGGHLAGKLWHTPSSTPSVSSSPPPPPIICIHGLQDNAATFDPLIPHLPPNLTLFAFDLPGHGFSSHTKELYYNTSFDGLLSIHRVMKHFDWPKVTLLGHSLGSAISFIFSATFPDQVHAYIALDNLHPIPRDDPTHGFQNVVNKSFQVEDKLNLSPSPPRPSYTWEEILNKSHSSRKGAVSFEGCRVLLSRGAQHVQGTDKEERYQFTHDIKTNIPASFRFLSREQVGYLAKRIKTRVCVIKGNPGEDFEPREQYLKVVELLRETAESMEFHYVEGTHHFHLDEPQKVAKILGKFLDKVNAIQNS